ncbi:MAG: hypothetical protein JOZ99_05560 [Actinobacteria bacterium]|nr:hypothetical protein [Actinomycetota bacterium]
MGEKNGVFDESFLLKYRQLLDAEDTAFDELEHAYEDGDRSHFENDLSEWRSVVERRLAFLERHGVMSSMPGLTSFT